MRLRLIDAARGTRIAPLRERRDRSQWLSGSALGKIQLEKLNALLAHASDRVPFYRALRDETGGRLLAVDSLDDITRLPVVHKEDRRRRPDAYRSELPPGVVVSRRTGGSTGAPLVYDSDTDATSGQWAAIIRGWEWSGYRFGDAMATVGGGSVAPSGGVGWRHRIYDALRRNTSLGAAEADDAGLARLADRLVRAAPALVYGYPSLLYRLAVELERRSIRPEGVRAVYTTSEMLFPGQRDRIRDAFGAPVHDQYGCNEVNLVATECGEHAGRHYAMESAFVEILDDEDRPLPPGKVGRIVGTSLDNRAMPFIRYDTGDYGALDMAPCACGRGLYRLCRLQGRRRDLVRAADGRMIHGVEFNELIYDFDWVDRYQVVQEDERRLRVLVSCSTPPDSQGREDLRRRAGELTGLQVTVDVDTQFVTTTGRKTPVIVSRLPDGHGS